VKRLDHLSGMNHAQRLRWMEFQRTAWVTPPPATPWATLAISVAVATVLLAVLL